MWEREYLSAASPKNLVSQELQSQLGRLRIPIPQPLPHSPSREGRGHKQVKPTAPSDPAQADSGKGGEKLSLKQN